MYGILIQALRYMVEDHFGASAVTEIFEKIGVADEFNTHERYSEKIVPEMMRMLSEMSGLSEEEIGVMAGRYFIRYMIGFGHGQLLRILGRRFGDFVKGLDNLHAYFRFSYPRLKPPSFSCDSETADGLTLHYRSSRRGYINYVMGQMIEIAHTFYDQEISVQLLRKQEKRGFQYVLIRLTFENAGFDSDQRLRDKNVALNEFLPVDPIAFVKLFPYFVAFDRCLSVVACGKALATLLPDLIGKTASDVFILARPLVKFKWDSVMHHLNDIFELKTSFTVDENVLKQHSVDQSISIAVPHSANLKIKYFQKSEATDLFDAEEGVLGDDANDQFERKLLLRGAMVYLKQSDVIIFLPSVIVDDLEELYRLTLKISDFSASDCNREMIMVAAQKPDDLKDLLEKEREKSEALVKYLGEIDESRRKAKDLLSTMMPPEVANQLLKQGHEGVRICEKFDRVSLSFTKVCHFNEITSALQPMDVVGVLNTIYSNFDAIIQKHGVYKVETVGECYLVSCGVPYLDDNYAEFLADTLLDLISRMESLIHTLIPGQKTQIKIGAHTGSVVGAVVGLRAPRYCLFGDTVNCSSRLESHNTEPMTIQISEAMKKCLDEQAPRLFVTKERGTVNLKGKGEMKAFGLVSKKGPARYLNNPMVRHTAAVEGAFTFSQSARGDSADIGTASRMSISLGGTASRASTMDKSGGSSNSSRPEVDANIVKKLHDLEKFELTSNSSDSKWKAAVKRNLTDGTPGVMPVAPQPMAKNGPTNVQRKNELQIPESKIIDLKEKQLEVSAKVKPEKKNEIISTRMQNQKEKKLIDKRRAEEDAKMLVKAEVLPNGDIRPIANNVNKSILPAMQENVKKTATEKNDNLKRGSIAVAKVGGSTSCKCAEFIEKERLKTTICSTM